jgi:hypothetical protein
MFRGLVLTLGLCLAAPGAVAQARQMTVGQLEAFIKSSIQLKMPDQQVADYVHKVKLTNKLDARTVEDLQGAGAGKRTVAALKDLITESSALSAPPPPGAKPAPVVIPAPDSVEQKKILEDITQKALEYSENLPNFLCDEVTRRHGDPSGQENWRLLDTIQERLTYFDHKEDYKVVMVNGQLVTNKTHDQLGGASSAGEFGSMMYEIFSPETEASFDWERWATLRGRRMYVFSFRVPQARSQYSIEERESRRKIIAGYHGLIYADRATGRVMRISMECDDIPTDFPIQKVSLDLNYDFTKIADQEFVLPLKADLRSREGRFLVWNEIEFHLYRKFGTESSITFEALDAVPEDQLKEQPAIPDPRPAIPEPRSTQSIPEPRSTR